MGAAVLLGLSAINPGVMADMMQRYSLPVASTRVNGAFEPLAQALSEGLFRGQFPMGMVDEPLFSAKEILHLKDCALLVRGVNLFGLLAAGTGGAGLAALAFFRRDTLLRGLKDASLGLFAAAALILIWGLVSFEGLFITFHRVFFTNDLWLLDPQKDLLIQLMPAEFFVAYCKVLLVRMLPVPLACLCICAVYWLGRRKKNGLS